MSSLLVPDEGAWIGATTPVTNGSGTTAAGLQQWEDVTSFRPQVLPWYKKGAWSGAPTSAEIALLDPPGQKHAIPKYAWKIGAGSAGIGTWTDVANGVYDTEIAAAAAGIKTYPHKVMLCIYHEPEDNVNGSGNTRAAYRAMWQHVVEEFAAADVDNVVWFLQYGGAANHAVDAAGSGFTDLYPGNDYVDWIGFDPYTHSPSRNTLDELVNWTSGGPGGGYPGFYTIMNSAYPTKPMLLGEFGAGNVGCQGNAATAGAQFTDSEGAAVAAQWQADLGVTNTALKMFIYWNGRASYDYQIQLACRTTLYGAAVAALVNDAYFDNDPDLAKI